MHSNQAPFTAIHLSAFPIVAPLHTCVHPTRQQLPTCLPTWLRGLITFEPRVTRLATGAAAAPFKGATAAGPRVADLLARVASAAERLTTYSGALKVTGAAGQLVGLGAAAALVHAELQSKNIVSRGVEPLLLTKAWQGT
jgi:hypothetical protein